MAVQGNFNTVFDEIFCSPQAAANQADLSGLIIEKLYDDINIDNLFTVVAPIRTGDPVAALYYPAVYNAVKNNTGADCSIEACDVSPEYTAKQWTIMLAECRHELCARNLDETFLAFWGKYKRVNPGSDEYDFAVDQITDIIAGIIKNTLLAKLWLSDTLFNEGSGGADDVLDGIDGFLAQAQEVADNVIDAGDTPLVGEDFYDKITEAITDFQASRFGNQLSDARLYMDRVEAFAFVAWLNKEGRTKGVNCDCIDPDGIVNADRFSVEGLRIHGIPVIVQPFADMMKAFAEYTVNGEPLYHNIALLSAKENLLVGTGNRDDLAFFDSFYNKDERKYKFDFGYTYGAIIPTDAYKLVIGEKQGS